MYPFNHPQVETEFGFTVDEQIVDIIKIIWNIGFKTCGSCQSTDERNNFGRRYVGITHENPGKLLKLAIFISDYAREEERKRFGWKERFISRVNQHIIVQGVTIWLSLNFYPDSDRDVIEALKHYE